MFKGERLSIGTWVTYVGTLSGENDSHSSSSLSYQELCSSGDPFATLPLNWKVTGLVVDRTTVVVSAMSLSYSEDIASQMSSLPLASTKCLPLVRMIMGLNTHRGCLLQSSFFSALWPTVSLFINRWSLKNMFLWWEWRAPLTESMRMNI